jgi:outer membrane protein OmpA-like peptidoglycan-associated protein
MVYRPFRSLSRFVLAAFAVSLGGANLVAQVPSATEGPSRLDIFTGYSYFGTKSQITSAGTQYTSAGVQINNNVSYTGVQYASINEGVVGGAAYFVSPHIGGEVSFIDNPDGPNDGAQGVYAGPILRAKTPGITYFTHGGIGAVRLGGPNNENPAGFEVEPYTWGLSLMVGGGMDYELPYFNHRFSIRLFQVDYRYIHVNYGPYSTPPITVPALGGRANVHAIEYSAGIVTHFGSVVPPPPVAYSCSVSPATVFPGDPVTVTGSPSYLNPKKTATYTWTSDAGPVSGTSTTANIDTKTLSAGTFTVKGHVTEGSKPGQSADCSAQFTVKAFEPPTISCSASPTSLNPGDSATITAAGVSPQNRPLTYSYSSTAGAVTGTSSSATLSSAGAAPGAITVTCNVVDDKGQSASATTSVTVIAPPPPPPPPVPTTSNLCSISFERDKLRPTRVDNEAKACLDDVALNLQRASDAKLAVVGNTDSKETAANAKKKKPVPFGAERAVNTKDYLVTEKGIDPSRISVYTGSADAQTVTTTLIPAGATLNTAGDTAVDESAVKAVPRTPVKKTRKKK